MLRRLLGLVLLIVAAGSLFAALSDGMGLGCAGKVDTSSPVAVAKAAIEAIDTGDTEEVCQYFTGVPAQQMRVKLDRLYSRTGKVNVDNVTVSLEYEQGIAARVWASYDLIVEAYGEVNVENVVVKLKLVDIEGTWLINEAF